MLLHCINSSIIAQKLGSPVDDESRQGSEAGSNEDSDFRSKTGSTPPNGGLKDLLEQANGHNGNGEHGGRTSSPPSPLGGKPKSLVDMIQMDFPRTPSPVYQKRELLAQQQQQQQQQPQLGRRASQSTPYYPDGSDLSSAMQNLSVNEVFSHTFFHHISFVIYLFIFTYSMILSILISIRYQLRDHKPTITTIMPPIAISPTLTSECTKTGPMMMMTITNSNNNLTTSTLNTMLILLILNNNTITISNNPTRAVGCMQVV